VRDNREWRVGTHYNIHVYAVNGPDKDDEPICTALHPWLADLIVADHNAVIGDRTAMTALISAAKSVMAERDDSAATVLEQRLLDALVPFR